MTQTELATALGLKQQQLTIWSKRGCPVSSVDAAREWIASNIKQRTKAVGLSKRQRANLPPAPAPDDVHSWASRLGRARQTELDLYRSLQLAIERGHTAQLAQLRANHAKAVRSVAEAEKIATDVQRLTGELVPVRQFDEIVGEVIVPLRSELEGLPVRIRSLLNPADPAHAEAILRREITAVLARLSALPTRYA